jgi:hypothetical protein
MQRFMAKLSSVMDQMEFEKSWNSNPAVTAEPRVEFIFAGTTISALVHSENGKSWPLVGFHQIFSAAVRRLDGACNIRWL